MISNFEKNSLCHLLKVFDSFIPFQILNNGMHNFFKMKMT